MATLELNPIPAAKASKKTLALVEPPTAPTAPAAEAAAEAAVKAPPTVADIVATLIASGGPSASIDNLTKVYLKVRNSHADLKKQAAVKLAPLDAALTLIENHFLAKMDELGVDSLKNKEGTPYKTTKTSVTVADNAAFVGFVLSRALNSLPLKPIAKDAIMAAIVDSGEFALIEARASKTAVEAFLENEKVLPDGINRRSEFAVNVKAS